MGQENYGLNYFKWTGNSHVIATIYGRIMYANRHTRFQN